MVDLKIKQCKMVFCDIDGTLIDSKHRISQGTKQKIQELSHSGVPFIMVSARMPAAILPYQRELGIAMPIICYSGALILNEHGSCIKTVGINRERAILLAELVKKEWGGVCCSAYGHHDWIVDNMLDHWVVQEQRITAAVPKQGALSAMIAPGGQIHKFLCMGEARQIAEMSRVLSEKYPALSIYRSKNTYLEIMDGAASKSAALKYLCEGYHISMEDTVSFGDGFNDVDMLRATGTSFAMGNAPEEVKKQAQFVTLDNDHEGVLVGLRQLNFAGNRL